MKQHWLVTCFVNFFIASVMGLLLRLMYVTPVEWINFQFLLHGHSHVAMLGWVYLMLYSLIVHFFLTKEAQQKAVYNRLFWVTQFSVIGMMFRFPVEGYALFSIAFSTLHIFCSYIFCRRIWKDAQPSSLSEEKLLRAALVFMVVSTVGVWCLGPAVGLLGKASAFYQIAIQFFLHFQFNGWFLFAVLALFFNQLKAKIDEKNFQLFYSLLIASTILTLALPVSWYLDNPVFYWINALGVTLQLVTFGVFIKIIKPKFHIFFSTLKRIEKLIYGFALLSLELKVGIQMVALLPGLDQVSHQIRNFVIGYIHLTMLGIISGFLLGFTLQNKFLNGTNIWVSLGLKIFLAGFVATEMLLFIQGAYLFFGLGEFPMYHQNLFIASIGLPTGLIILIISLFQSAERIKIIARD